MTSCTNSTVGNATVGNASSSCQKAKPQVPMMMDEYCPTQRYSKLDPCMLYQGFIVKSLTDEPNGDDPIVGAIKASPTWSIKPLCALALDPTVVDNGDGTFTWTSADGSVAHTWSTSGMVRDNKDGTFTWIHPDGTENPAWSTSGMVRDNKDGTFTWIYPDGTVGYTWSTSGVVRDNKDGTVSWISPDGSVGVTWDKTDTDTHMGDFVPKTNKDGSTTFTSTLRDHKGHAVKGAETQSFTIPSIPEDKFVVIKQDPDGVGAVNIYEGVNVDDSKVRWRTNEGLPVGIQQVGAGVYGEFKLHPSESLDKNIFDPAVASYGFPLAPVTKTFTVADYPLLAVKGLKLQIGVSSTAAVRIKHGDNGDTTFPKRDNQQWGQGVKVNGQLVAKTIDFGLITRFGDALSFTDHLGFEYISDGTDFEVEVFNIFIVDKVTITDWKPTDFMGIDMFSSIISFVAV